MENFQDKIIYFDIEVNELYAMIDITQTYRNISNTSLEIKIKLPKTKNRLLKFTAKINEEKLFQSKVLDIEKAKEKYTDSISSGNTGLIAYQSDDDFTVINIGNLLYDDILELTTTYYQLLSKYNNKSILDLNFDYPCFLDCNFNQINTDINNIEIFSNIRFNTFYNLTNVNIDNLSSKQYSKEIDKNSGKYNLSYNEKINNIIPIKIIFESENNEKNLLFIQNNEKFKETSYFLNYKIPEEITEAKMDINQDPILFIFVLDQSGSMRGTPLDLVKTSLKIFLHSLPQNSYFQLIGFGSTFIKYNDTPIKFTPENIRNLDNLIDNLNAKLGGTYLLSPMEDILGNNNYTNFKNSKHLFILTDGEVELRDETLDYIIKNQ
jgi:Ca-activated chloride channel family protein